ncbi:hypothetical protein K6969_03185 [Streptococcus suis]|uniref:hypothetical protein n=1 Tax=Streptococcus suis TaxID=1307 RepID=UPI000CF380BC|nr:hypothetical protein [Streptococcus suis]QZT29937.1 hypothetical protein K6969_03185 [Streptococcus suis]HEL2553135.1 hypothetical protein [Streptococcus suis]HEM2795210.1 hypothetical protein [Streptococcus suis]HEM2826233.1 hypothetical protein [Streptococcus suis]HEM5055414.1 hypothetical protein [Streptococcus suis]
MSITITRETGAIGASGKLHLLVNGQTAGSVGNKKTITLKLTGKTAQFAVKGDKKSTIEVENGDQITITSNKLYFSIYIISLLAIIALAFLNFTPFVEMVIARVALMVFLASNFLLPRFQLLKQAKHSG